MTPIPTRFILKNWGQRRAYLARVDDEGDVDIVVRREMPQPVDRVVQRRENVLPLQKSTSTVNSCHG